MNKNFIFVLMFVFIISSLFLVEDVNAAWSRIDHSRGGISCPSGKVNCDDYSHCGTSCSSGNYASCCCGYTGGCGGGGGGVVSCTVTNCVTSTTLVTASPNISLSGCVIGTSLQVNGVNYSSFGTPGATLNANGFGQYNFALDSGGTQQKLAFGGIFLNTNISSNYPAKTNSTAPLGTPQSSGLNRCVASGGCNIKGPDVEGIGDQSSISYNLATAGGHNYELKIATSPIAGTMPSAYTSQFSNNIYVGFPSLIVSGQNDLNTGFVEKFGLYNKELVFTLINKSPLDVNIENYRINCERLGVSCSVDANYKGWTIEKLEGTMIIRGNLIIDKNYLPISNVSVWLDVNYTIPLLITPDCSQYYRNNTSSKPVSYKFGLLDMQKFQVGMKANYDYTGCIGEDGMIGETGEAYVPKINLGFGGKTNSLNELVSIDECDAKTLDDSSMANGSDNNDWVYCSQKELIVELTRKVGKLWEIGVNQLDENAQEKTRLDLTKNKYASTQMYIRKQTLSPSQIEDSITLLKTNFSGILQNIGLPNSDYASFAPSSPSTTEARLKNLFSNTEITINGGQGSGEVIAAMYAVNISVEVDPDAEQTTLFVNGNALNPAATIKIDFTKLSDPSFNWFFYEYGNLEIDKNIDTIHSNFWKSNSEKRGILLTMAQSGLNDDLYGKIDFYPGWANTLIAQLKSNASGDINSYFTLSNDFASNYQGNDTFSYWTAFASSIGNGCTDIDDESDGVLSYREPDSLRDNTDTTFDFNNYSKSKPNSTTYLQTVLFWPNNYPTNPVISSPLGLMIDKNWNSSPVVNKQVNTRNEEFNVTNLEDLFKGIGEEKICINATVSASRTTQWTLFWNQTSIYDSIKSAKENLLSTNADATLCETREALGG